MWLQGSMETALLLVWVASALTCSWLAARKGFRVRDWFWLGCGLGFLALIILLVQPARELDGASGSDPR